jgi:glycerophosphoryl diester phosphodiesterase
MLSSFNIIALIRARSLLQKIPLGLITITGLAELTLRSKLVRFGPLFALHPNFMDITPKLIQASHRTNSRVHTYIVNDPEDMRRLFITGVDGIFTKDPLIAHKVLSEIR